MSMKTAHEKYLYGRQVEMSTASHRGSARDVMQGTLKGVAAAAPDMAVLAGQLSWIVDVASTLDGDKARLAYRLKCALKMLSEQTGDASSPFNASNVEEANAVIEAVRNVLRKGPPSESGDGEG